MLVQHFFCKLFLVVSYFAMLRTLLRRFQRKSCSFAKGSLTRIAQHWGLSLACCFCFVSVRKLISSNAYDQIGFPFGAALTHMHQDIREEQSKVILMGHQSCYAPVVRSLYIFWMTMFSPNGHHSNLY
jgi:hypothetical protein